MKTAVRISAIALFFAFAAAASAQPPGVDVEAIFQKAVQDMNAKKYDEAIEGFTEVVRWAPQASGGWVFRGMSYFNKARQDMAVKREAMKNGAEVSRTYLPNSLLAIEDLTKVIEMFPNFESKHAILAYRFRANTYLVEGDYERALPDLKVLADKFPDYKATNESPTSVEFYRLSKNGYANVLFEMALKVEGDEQANLLRKVIANYDPTEYKHFSNRANAFQMLKEYAKAITDYKAALNLKPNDVQTLYGLAQSYYFNKEYQAALDVTEKAVLLPNVGMWIGSFNALRPRIWIGLGRFDEALDHYNSVINSGRKTSYDHYERGRIYAIRNQKELARADFLKALELSKTNHLQNGKYPEAQYELDVLDGKIKTTDEATGPKTVSAEKPIANTFTFTKTPAPEPFESQFQQAMDTAANTADPSLHRQKAFLNFYNAVAKSTLADADKKKHIANKIVEVAMVDMYAAYRTVMDANISNTYAMALTDAMPREMRKKIRETSSLEVAAYLEKKPKPKIEEIFPPGVGWGKAARNDRAEDLPEAKTADYHFKKGLIYLDEKKYLSAIASFNNAIRSDPKNAQAYYNLGLSHVGLSEVEKDKVDSHYFLAGSYFRQAIDLDPRYELAYQKAGELHYAMMNLDIALEYYTKAIQINPSNPDNYSLRSMVYKKMNEPEKEAADIAKYRSLKDKLNTPK